MSPSPLSRERWRGEYWTRGHVGTEGNEHGEQRSSACAFYGVVSAQTEKVVEFFLERETAEAMIGEVREDEPLLANDLRVEAVEL